MSIDTYEIKKQLNSLAEKFTYKPIENERSEDLEKFITTIWILPKFISKIN